MDRRSQRTRDFLLRAMVDLMQHKPWEDITIREICEAADIARSTFYLHFASKEELRRYGFQFLENELRDNPIERCLDDDGKFGCLPHLLRVMTAPQHQFLFANANGSRSADLARNQMNEIVAKLIESEIRSSRRFRQTSQTCISFIAAGIQAAAEAWHHKTDRGDLDRLMREMDETIGRIICAPEAFAGQPK